MNIGRIRKARVGEIPTHYAMEDIRANEAVVAQFLNQTQENAGQSVSPMFFPRGAGKSSALLEAIGIDLAKPGAEMTVIVEREIRRSPVWEAELMRQHARQRREYRNAQLREKALLVGTLIVGVSFILFAAYRALQGAQAAGLL
jgi:hypothetical protein